MTGRVALDIETVSPSLEPYERPPAFDDPQYYELFSVALAHETPDGARETAHLVRENSDPAAELGLVERVTAWLREREAETYVTYNGESFDVPILLGRAEAVAAATPTGPSTRADLTGLLTSELGHDDPREEAWASFGEYIRLEEALEAVGIESEPTPWRDYDHNVDLDDVRPSKYRGIPHVINKDVPLLGERCLTLADAGATDTLTYRELSEMLDHYALEDVAHLFDLADARPF